jgi:UPF0716 family protein affecting phage T7 exclusion
MTNPTLFALLLLKVGFLCGFLPTIAILIFAECAGFRIVRIGFEKVSRRAVSRDTSIASSDGHQPAGNVLARAA